MIKNKKAMSSMLGVILMLLVALVLFYGFYGYVDYNYDSANVSLPINYSDSYESLQIAESELNDSIEGIKGAAQNISEAEGNIVTVAWNGLTGIAYTIRLMFDIVDVAVDVWAAIVPPLSFLPTWIILLAEMALIITIVLIIIGLFKGESKTT